MEANYPIDKSMEDYSCGGERSLKTGKIVLFFLGGGGGNKFIPLSRFTMYIFKATELTVDVFPFQQYNKGGRRQT